jgi:hypothetical protein
VAATANLFVRRDAFESAGGFDAGLVSGGDEDFCLRSVARGERIVAAPGALVRHEPRRTFREIARKSRRIGFGTGQRFRRGRFPILRLAAMLAVFLPRARFLRRGTAEPPLGAGRRLSLFLVDWAMKFPSAAGILRGLIFRGAPGVRGGSLRFSLHGVTVEVASEDERFLSPLAATFRDHLAPRSVPDIVVRFGGAPPAWASPIGGEALGPRLARCAEGVRWTNPPELPGLDLALSLGSDRLSVFARHDDPLSARKGVIDFCVYFPIFWWLGRTRGFRLLSATGVAASGRGLLVSGLGGDGGTTLSAAARGFPGARLLSNHLVLHDHAAVAAVPDSVPSNAASDALEMPVDRAVILSFGDANALLPLTPQDAARELRAADDSRVETRHFRSFSTVMDLAFPDAPPVATEDPLERLLRQAACYRLVVRRGDSPKEIAERVLSAAISADARPAAFGSAST